MHREARDKHFLKKPAYPGGPKAMRQFVGENLRYPPEALEGKVEGTVVVHYTIDSRGEVVEAKVISGVGSGCDEEALRLVKLLKFDVPKNRGVRVLFHQKLQIHFHLPKQQPVQQVQYSYVVKPKVEEPEEKPQGGGYTISVQFSN